jgi:hypothetical protein
MAGRPSKFGEKTEPICLRIPVSLKKQIPAGITPGDYLLSFLPGNTPIVLNQTTMDDTTKHDIQTVIQLFKRGIETKSFLNLVSDDDANAIERLETVINE